MVDFGYDDYFESSDFYDAIEDFKKKLKQSVKAEIDCEISRLRKENEELQEVKENFKWIKEECNRKIHDAKQMRLKEVMEKFKVVTWRPIKQYQYIKKCNKCDEKRNIQIVLPSGTPVNDRCKCNMYKTVYHPEEMILYELTDTGTKFSASYIPNKNYDEYELDLYIPEIQPSEIINQNQDVDFSELEKKRHDDVFFSTKSGCQKFCDYLNNLEQNAGYDYTLKGNFIVND